MTRPTIPPVLLALLAIGIVAALPAPAAANPLLGGRIAFDHTVSGGPEDIYDPV